MSHHPTIISPTGTPIADRSVGELVAESPGLSRVFQHCKLDFCCQGSKTLREACAKKGLDLNAVIDALNKELENRPESEENPAELPPVELIDYIVEVHHGFLRRELPRLHAMAQRVAQVHGGHTPSLVEVLGVFESLFAELDSHMKKEEQILFPTIKVLAGGDTTQAAPFTGPLDGPISMMRHEHDDAGAALARLRELTNDHQPPADACNTYRALFAGLADLEDDLHRHIHLENSVLFPAAEALVEQTSSVA